MAVRANLLVDVIPALKLGVVEGSERPGEAPFLRFELRFVAYRLGRRRCVPREGSARFETGQRAADGSVWPVEASVSYWPVEGGRMLVDLRDVHRRRRSEALLRTRYRLSEMSRGENLDRVVQAALDGYPRTGWAIHPQVGKDHTITFRTKQPLAIDPEVQINITLDQQYGDQNTIGRFKLFAITGDHAPIELP